MKRLRGLRLALVAALGVATLLAGLSLALPLGRPGAWDLDHPRLAPVSEARAVAAAEAKPADLAEVERQTRATLTERPLDAAAWARLAWVADRRGDTSAMLEALDRSYVAAPYGPEVTAWRLRFAFDRWPDLSPELRSQVRSELAVARRTRPRLVLEIETSVADPAGRMAMALTTEAAPPG